MLGRSKPAIESGTWIARFDPFFWLETFALWTFGISWGVKGETILKDQP
jgi:hypothetical protein